jgi:integrase
VTLVRNAKGIWEADCREGVLPRLHLSLGTKRRAEAEVLHAALVQFRREGDRVLDALLRQRNKQGGGITVQQLAACVRERRPFSTLRPSLAWPTVGDAIDAYAAWLGAHPEREQNTAATAKRHLKPFGDEFGALPIDGVNRAAAEAWQTSVGARYAVNTFRVIVGRVVGLYAWCAAREAREAIDAGREARALHCPLDPDTRPTRSVSRERFLTHAEAARLIAATPDAILAAVGCGLLAGLRIEEALHLRPTVDVDLARDMLVIQERGEKGKPGYWRPKGGKRREVPITADLRPLLVRHLGRWSSDWYVFPAASRPDRTFLDDQLRDLFKPCVEAAGLVYGRDDPQGVVFHTLRHTFASWLVMADVSLTRIAKLMGNSTAIVEKTYGHLAPADNRAAVALLSGAVPFPTLEEAA